MIDLPLDAVDLPTRMRSWARAHGVTTLRGLAALSPRDLRRQRNVGRLTIAQTRAVIEHRLGARWEDLSRDAAPPARAGSDAWLRELAAKSRKASLVRALPRPPETPGDVPLDRVPLPTRMDSWAQRNGVTTLRHLAWIPPALLLRERNVGRISVAETRAEIEARLGARWEELACPPPGPSAAEQARRRRAEARLEARRERLAELLRSGGLLEAWRMLLSELPGDDRVMVERNAGLGGPRESLRKLGERVGVPHARIQQRIVAAVRRFHREGALQEAVRERLARALSEGAVRLETLAADRWWAGIASRPVALAWFCERVLVNGAHVVEVDGCPYLARVSQAVFDEAWLAVRHQGMKVPLPASPGAFHALVDPWVPRLGPVLGALLREGLDTLLLVDRTAAEPQVLRFGASQPEETLVFLRASPRPVTVAELRAKVGHGVLPREALRLGRSLIGVERHFPDFASWMRRLVPPAIRVMTGGPRGRRWSQAELHRTLCDENDLPGWLGPWHLGSLLRRSGKVRCFPVGRFALLDAAGHVSRGYVAEAIRALRAAGAPLSRAALNRALERRMSVNETTLTVYLSTEPFVHCGRSRYGLIERDLPGGVRAIRAAADRVAARLARKGSGMTDAAVHAVVLRLGGPHRSWTKEMCLSALARDPRLIRGRGGATVGLAAWGSTRLASRSAIFRECLERGGGRVRVSTVLRRLEASSHGTLDRTKLWSLAQANGATLRGAFVERRATAAPAGRSRPSGPPPPPPGRTPAARPRSRAARAPDPRGSGAAG